MIRQEMVVDAILRCSNMSKSEYRRSLRVDHSNPLVEADRLLSEHIFGVGTPIRFLRYYGVQSKEAGELRLKRALDAYRYLKGQKSPVLERLDQLSQFTHDNIYQKQDEYKSIIKSWMKDNSLLFRNQFEHSFLLSLYIHLTDDIKDKAIADYYNEFGRSTRNNDEPYFSPYDEDAIKYLSNYIGSITEPKEISKVIPAPSTSYSSVGRRKKYDGLALINLTNTGLINPYAKQHIIRCLEAISEHYQIDVSSSSDAINNLEESENTMNGLEFLPRLTMIPQNKGKIARPVFPSTDYSDMALRPFMQLIKLIMSELPCNLSREGKKKSMYTRVSEKSNKMAKGIVLDKRAKVSFSGGMEDLDSSNATERESGNYHWAIFWKIWKALPEDWRLRTGITDKYLKLCQEILCDTPFIVQYSAGIFLSWPYGTSQGLMGSWDLLNLCTCVTIYFGYLDMFREQVDDVMLIHRCSLRMLNASGCNGDDGLYAEEASSFIKNRLQANSLEGVVSAEKSAAESELGYLNFSSAYVRTSKAPKLSNMRMLSTISAQSDPFEYLVYISDLWMRRQLALVRSVLEEFKESFNWFKLPIYTDADQIQASYRYSLAANALKFAVYQSAKPVDILDIVPGTDMNLTRELTASLRCKTVIVHNSAISAERYELLQMAKQLEQCFDLGESVVGNFIEQLENARDDYVLNHQVPQFEDCYYQQLFNTYLLGAQCQEQIVLTKDFFIHENGLLFYNFIYEGYSKDDQVIHVYWKWG